MCMCDTEEIAEGVDSCKGKAVCPTTQKQLMTMQLERLTLRDRFTCKRSDGVRR